MGQLGFLNGLVPEKRSLEKRFIEMVLQDNTLGAMEIAERLIPAEPMFLVVSCLLNFLGDPEDGNRRNRFLASLEKIKVKNDLLWMLCKKGLLIEQLQVHIGQIMVKDQLYYLILKETYIKGHHSFLRKGGLLGCAEFLLENLDDWDIYQYALDNNLALRDRKSLNYEYYLLHRSREQDRAIKLLESRTCFKEIKLIADLVELKDHPNETVDCIIQLTRNGFDDGLLERAYDIYRREANLLSVKMVLAVLVSSKRPELLTLALYLSSIHRDVDTRSYEVSLIFMFLCRYFCYYPCVLKLLSELNVKNAQIPNLSFIWSDILLTKNIQDADRRNKFLESMKGSIRDLENGVRHLINAGNISHVIDILALRKSYIGSVVVQEVSEGKITGTNPSNTFLLLLGERCSYVFEKMTVGKLPKGKTVFLTDYYIPSSPQDERLLENDLHNISDESFRSFFRDLLEYCNAISIHTI